MKQKKSAVPDAIEESIRPFAIPEKLRGLRLKKSMGLAQLAQHTGLSPAMLSRLENGRLVPTLPTLARIALVFDVGLDYFFNDPRKRHVVAIARRQERRKFPAEPQNAAAPWHFESLDFRARDRRFNGFLAHFHPVPRTRLLPHFHPGAELLYLIEGELELSIGIETICLSAGDSIYFDSIQKHAYRNAGAGPCTAVVVTSRQLF